MNNILQIAGIEINDLWSGTAGQAIKAFELCYIGPNGFYYLASAESNDTMPGLIIACEDIPVSGFGHFYRSGKITNSNWSFTPGKLVHAGLVPGSLSHEFPGSRKFLQIVGIALAVNQIDFNPNLMLIEEA